MSQPGFCCVLSGSFPCPLETGPPFLRGHPSPFNATPSSSVILSSAPAGIQTRDPSALQAGALPTELTRCKYEQLLYPVRDSSRGARRKLPKQSLASLLLLPLISLKQEGLSKSKTITFIAGAGFTRNFEDARAQGEKRRGDACSGDPRIFTDYA